MDDETPKKVEDSEQSTQNSKQKNYKAESFGLGLGVDGSVHSPWSKGLRKDFPARPVSSKSKIITIDGHGKEYSYHQDVKKTFSIHSDQKVAIPIDDAVVLGVDFDLHSDHTESKIIVGKRVEDITVSFNDSLSIDEVDQPSEGGFENKLCSFILNAMKRKIDKCSAKRIEDLLAPEKNHTEEISMLCSKFIADHKITHYAHSLELGAIAYFVIKKEENNVHAGGGGKIDFAGLLEASCGLQGAYCGVTTETRMLMSPAGAFTVEKGTKDIKRNPDQQAVIKIKLKPVSSLIKNQILKQMVERASKDYIAENSSIEEGGYCITCEYQGQNVFFKVNGTTLTVTADKNEASVFHIVVNEKPKLIGKRDTNEFCIGYNKEQKPKRSLKTYITSRGYNSGALQFMDNEASSLTILHHLWKPGSTFKPMEPTPDWTDGENAFYINCKHSPFRTDSFICVKESCQKCLEVGCTPDIKEHNHGACMLFRLVDPYKLKNNN